MTSSRSRVQVSMAAYTRHFVSCFMPAMLLVSMENRLR